MVKALFEEVTGAAPLRPVVDDCDLSGDGDRFQVDLFRSVERDDVELPHDLLGERRELLPIFARHHGVVADGVKCLLDLRPVEAVCDLDAGDARLPVESDVTDAVDCLQSFDDRRSALLAVDPDDSELERLRRVSGLDEDRQQRESEKNGDLLHDSLKPYVDARNFAAIASGESSSSERA